MNARVNVSLSLSAPTYWSWSVPELSLWSLEFLNLSSLVALTIIGASFGCAVAAIIWSLGKYWTHITPAITVAHAVAGAIRQGVLIPYVGSNIGRFVSWLDSTAYVSIR